MKLKIGHLIVLENEYKCNYQMINKLKEIQERQAVESEILETNSAVSNSYEININKLSSTSNLPIVSPAANPTASSSEAPYFKLMFQKSQGINSLLLSQRKVNRLKTIMKLADASKYSKLVKKLKTQIKDVKKEDSESNNQKNDSLGLLLTVKDSGFKRRSSFVSREPPKHLMLHDVQNDDQDIERQTCRSRSFKRYNTNQINNKSKHYSDKTSEITSQDLNSK